MLKKILIANRGEISCRIIKTCRKMGIQTIAVYSDIDKHAEHVESADESYHIGSSPAQDSYLNINNIIHAAKETGADSIHPGYGFLAENVEFANAIINAGLIFIGPSPSSMQSMGEKSTAKGLMEKTDIPILLGYHGDEQKEDALLKHAIDIGFPILIKASAGGGGKGMRIVDNKEEFPSALKSAKREAKSAFGNDHILLEKFLKNPRHIEVQIFGDNHGNYVVLSERDCSIQRRQQKIIEEAPAPNIADNTRSELAKTAVKIAKSIDYTGAGTIEFLMDKDEKFYFMEMNTRLQVEHPVTEMITGLDLVEWQLRVASGEKLPLSQDQITITGHAIETRIYAEDPANDFLPAAGRIVSLKWPRIEDNLRIETGIREGDEVSAFYDPMIAKLVTHGKNREQACTRMAKALNGTYIVGLKNNVAFLERALHHPAFIGNQPKDLSTGFITSYQNDLQIRNHKTSTTMLALAALSILRNEINKNKQPSNNKELFGWRLNVSQVIIRRYEFGENHISCTIMPGNKISLTVNNSTRLDATLPIDHCPGAFSTTIEEKDYTVTGILKNKKLYLFIKDLPHIILNWKDPLDCNPETTANTGTLTAPMTGRIIALHVVKGDAVQQGQPLAVMEAMKMEHTIHAPIAGTVANINVSIDAQVQEGVKLITLE